MTHQDFTFWLKGFLENKEEITKEDLALIKVKMNQVSNFTITSIPVSPNQVPNIPYFNPPFNPTC
jgi:hypothetical protein